MGDIAEVVRIRKFEEKYGFHFVNVTLKLIDYKDVELDCKIILDTLTSESPSLTQTDQKRFVRWHCRRLPRYQEQKEVVGKNSGR